MDKQVLRVIHYVIVALMLSTSTIYFLVTCQQFTDESGDGIREIPNEKEVQHGTSDMDSSQWLELDLGGKVQTVFFLVVAIVYVPVGLWILKQKHSNLPHVMAFVGSLSLIILYVISRTASLPIVGIQNDIGTIDIVTKIFQIGIVASTAYLIIRRRKQEQKIIDR